MIGTPCALATARMDPHRPEPQGRGRLSHNAIALLLNWLRGGRAHSMVVTNHIRGSYSFPTLIAVVLPDLCTC